MDLRQTQAWSYIPALPDDISSIRRLLQDYSSVAVDSVDEHLLRIVSATTLSLMILDPLTSQSPGISDLTVVSGTKLGRAPDFHALVAGSSWISMILINPPTYRFYFALSSLTREIVSSM